ncbi:Glycosyl hydrolases family 38 protein [Trichomonas vaginalis G3]|uniref:alpha-mannosidase n=1 Tax=Trichomonas vaginalis (strain ATCC PRA-98 / G3) TaxID=412133 RepID=A2EY99_TRIV3|nr:glycosyl hydrolase [Trichomonas vaginalis G3]EAY02387.1 Glycosyl hydrolases family 38 protein [Trichomonas vaginalis G3]KAI5501191.1 alpha-mannosidase 2C1 family [Trichomonas vaginalis G3]|eukprot:XP_001330648.1 glycosyl hydrolase [Trichomonas vaginalis G3]
MLNSLFLLSIKKVYDKKFQLKKVSKYIHLIAAAKDVNFIFAEDSYFTPNATADFIPPSQLNYTWIPMKASEDFKFNETKKNWFAFKGNVKIPKEYSPHRDILRLTFDVAAHYNVRRWDDEFPAGPEGQIWLNGKHVGAIDEFHNSHIITEGGLVEIRLYTGRCSSSHVLNKFGITISNRWAEKLYYYLKVTEKLLKDIPENNTQRDQIIDILNEVLPMIDIREITWPIVLPIVRYHDRDLSNFFGSLPNALDKLMKLLKTLPQHTEDDPFINVIGYSHLDSVWEWPFNISHYKFRNTVSSMIHLFENPPTDEIPKWRFLATSPLHYKWLEKDDPILFEKLMEYAKKDRIEVDGLTFVEMDTNLPSGEALVRQVLYGVKYFEGKLGFKQSTLFLPDCFGFSPSIPQILKNAGIENFVTSKISWNEYNSFPHHTFIWKGIDGSQIYSHFITTPSSWSYQAFTYTGLCNMREIVGTYSCYNEKFINGVALHTAGNGDGGGGLTEEMLYNMEVLNKLPKIEGVPHLKFNKLSEIFEKIKKYQEKLPLWDGELYLEYHRGTATTQELVKKQNKMLEQTLHNVEWLLSIYKSLFWQNNVTFYKEAIEELWEETMMLQFHDSLPGTCINEANNDIVMKGQNTLRKLNKLQKNLTEKLTEKMKVSTEENTKILFNTLPFVRKLNGITVPSGGWTFTTTEFPYIDYKVDMYEILESSSEYKKNEFNFSFIEPKNDIKVSSTDNETFSVLTDELNVTFSKINGSILQIRSLKTKRPFLRGPSNMFEFYEDRSIHWPAWDIQLFHKEMPLKAPKFLNYSIENNSIQLSYIICDEPECNIENENCHGYKNTRYLKRKSKTEAKNETKIEKVSEINGTDSKNVTELNESITENNTENKVNDEKINKNITEIIEDNEDKNNKEIKEKSDENNKEIKEKSDENNKEIKEKSDKDDKDNDKKNETEHSGESCEDKPDEENDSFKVTIINQTIYFREKGVIDFVTFVDWHEHDKLLKILYQTNIRSKSAKYGTQFGHHERPTHGNLPQDMAMFEVNGKWADYSDSTGGIYITSDSKYGNDIHEGDLRMSLLKAPLQTDMWADYGRREFTYRMMFHDKEENIEFQRQNLDLVTDFVIANYEQPNTTLSLDDLPMEAQFVNITGNVILDTLKLSEDEKGIVVRVFEANGGWTECSLSFPLLNRKNWKIVPCNLLEKEVKYEFNVDESKSYLSFSFEIETFKILSFKLERVEE